MIKILDPFTRLFGKEDPKEDFLHIFGIARKKKKFVLIILRQYLQQGMFEYQKATEFGTVQEVVDWINKIDPLARVGISDHGNVLGTAILGLRRYLNDSSLAEPALTASIELGKKEKGVPNQTNLLAKYDTYKKAGALVLTNELKKNVPSYTLDVDEKNNATPYYVQDFKPIFNAALCCLHDFPFKPEDILSPAVRDNAFKGYLFRKENKVESEVGSPDWLEKFHDSTFITKPKLSKTERIAKGLGPDAEWNRHIAHERKLNPEKADLLVKLAALNEKHGILFVGNNMEKYFTSEEIELLG